MDVNYGRELKAYLLREVTLLRIHRFDPTDVQFDDALVSSAIVWLRNERPNRAHEVEFSYGGTLSRPKTRGLVATSRLERAAKWTGFPTAPPGASDSGAPTLGDYFRVQRGIATGANRFFIMTAEQAAQRRIPGQCLRAILPGPRHLDLDEVHADAMGQPQLARRLWILDCRLSEEEIRDRLPDLWLYLDAGKAEIAKGYLCGRRAPWYAQEVRAPTFFLCTYIARRRRDGRTQRFIFNRSQAIAANGYLMLYPRPALERFIAGDPERARLVWQVLSKIGAATLSAGGRVYGGGLYKIEPRSLRACRFHRWPRCCSAERTPVPSCPQVAGKPQQKAMRGRLFVSPATDYRYAIDALPCQQEQHADIAVVHGLHARSVVDGLAQRGPKQRRDPEFRIADPGPTILPQYDVGGSDESMQVIFETCPVLASNVRSTCGPGLGP